jgi:hypothetical protein
MGSGRFQFLRLVSWLQKLKIGPTPNTERAAGVVMSGAGRAGVGP